MRRGRLGLGVAIASAGTLAVAGCTDLIGLSDVLPQLDGGADGNARHPEAGHDATSDAKQTHESGAADAMGDAPRSMDAPASDGARHADASDAAELNEAGCPTSDPSRCTSACVNLTSDSKNCGVCGHSCLGGTCSSSQCSLYAVVPASATSQIQDVASNGLHVVWADIGNNTINDWSGGTNTVLATSGSGNAVSTVAAGNGSVAVNSPINIALAGTLAGNQLVAWTQINATTNPSLQLAELGVSDTDVQVFQGAETVTYSGLSVDASGNLYYVADYPPATGPFGLCGAIAAEASGYSTNFEVSGNPEASCIETSVQVGYTVGVAPEVGGTGDVVFGDIANGQLVLPVSGNANGTLANQPNAYYVTNDPMFQYVYWTTYSSDPDTTTIRRAALASPTGYELVTTFLGGVVNGLATDGTRVYFVSGADVYAAPATPSDGGSASPGLIASLGPGAGTATLAHLKYFVYANPDAGVDEGALVFDDSRNIYQLATP